MGAQAVLYLVLPLLAIGRPTREALDATELTVHTYDWVPEGGGEEEFLGAFGTFSTATGAAVGAMPPGLRLRTRSFADEPPREAVAPPPPRPRETSGGPRGAPGGRGLQEAELMQAVWDRSDFRRERYDLQPTEGEHSCFAGFTHMVNNTDRCRGWVRQYPAVGGSVVFKNTGLYRDSEFMLKAVVADHINVWLEQGSSAQHEDISIKAARIYANDFGIEELRPATGSGSWMDHECKIMGAMPYMFTCSNRINILVQQCGISNAWVRPSDYLRNYPDPATAASPSNHDIIFYMCHELLDDDPNPYRAATTFAHELAHVIQGGFGHSFTAMTEGGATWLEGPLLKLPPRPMVFAWGFRDWNRILAAHFYASTIELNARKFYQIHGMFLSYLSQPELLGDHAASALQNYETFDSEHEPWGRAAYDYFLKYLGTGRPATFEPMTMEVQDVHFAFADALLDYRVALAAQCILDPALRPEAAAYRMPESMRERPYWDCSSFPTTWSTEATGVQGASAELYYGGAAIFRLAVPEDPTVSVAAGADPRVRTKVLAAGVAGGPAAEVRELRPGERASFEGAREVYVVQVNVDPAGEAIGPEDRPRLWHRTSYHCDGPCRGEAWWAGAGQPGRLYQDDSLASLRTGLLHLPEAEAAAAEPLELTFDAMWDLEAASADGSRIGPGCHLKGFDGVQVRALVVENTTGEETVVVLVPEGGYGHLAQDDARAVAAFSQLYGSDAPCDDFEGWSGSSGNASSRFLWRSQRVSLQPLAGQSVRLEWLFASDAGVGLEGFWLHGVQVRAGAAQVLSIDEGAMEEQAYTRGPLPGAIGLTDGVPVIAALPMGYVADSALAKVDRALSAAWSASWARAAGGSEAALRRSYLGWSYGAPAEETRTALLHPGQEACVQHVAPFRGALRAATLFTLVDKMGVSAVTLVLRAPSPPHTPLGGAPRWTSPSQGVHDPGMHRFDLQGRSPVFDEGEAFLLCIGTGGVKPLPADDPNGLPFLHLPLTNVSTAGQPGAAGATALITVASGGEQAAQTTGLDPWNGHSFVLRAEVVEVVLAAADEGGSSSSHGSLRR